MQVIDSTNTTQNIWYISGKLKGKCYLVDIEEADVSVLLTIL